MDGGAGGGLRQVRPHHVHVVRDEQGHLQDPRLRRGEEQPLRGGKTSAAGRAGGGVDFIPNTFSSS